MLLIGIPETVAAPKTSAVHWTTVVNNNDYVPGSAKNFNSYNQPSVNSRGLVVFRARGKGPSPLSGIFKRDISGRGKSIVTIADRNTTVPQPNNTCYPSGSGGCPPAGSGEPATFNEFPSFPRVALSRDFVATRGNSQPVWTYTEDGVENRAGTSGVFLHSDGGELMTGASQLGAVPDFAIYQVPDTAAGIRFDQFPGAPAVTDTGVVVFKGNYTFGDDSATGVFFRDVAAGDAAIQLVANSSTVIPGSVAGTTFGSTAPPSAAADKVVFLGVDDEEGPREGGIYLASLLPNPDLVTLVALGSPVPGKDGATFSRFGEGLSFDGRFVAFWGAWGTETKALKLFCPSEGNADRIAFCNEQEETRDGFIVNVPQHQGIFVHDISTGNTHQIAGTDNDFDDFLYWNYSGAPPGGEHGDEGVDDQEPPRWRSSAFAAVSSNGSALWVAWKARRGDVVDMAYQDPVDGIYLRKKPGRKTVQKMVDTRTPGTMLDPDAMGTTVEEVGLERDGLRGNLLVINASMSSDAEEDGMAGVYLARVR